jgi:hypothetical protein
MKKSCDVCGNKNLIEVLNLGNHPLCDDLILIGSSAISDEYPIKIVYCDKCFTAFQDEEVSKYKLFHKDYHYRAKMTGSVLSGMNDLVQSAENFLGPLENKVILDIGCNDGSLLDFFFKKGCKTYGVEPTNAALDSNHNTLNMFFDKTAVKHIKNNIGKIDIVTFTNVFAHIENLPELLNNIKSIINNETTIIIENHYLGAVLEKDQFDTFYHEHPRTYSQTSFEFIAETLGLNLVNVQYVSRYGGNIRVFLKKGKSIDSANKIEKFFLSKFSLMQTNINEWILSTKKMILDYVDSNGKIRAKAFPGRAAILIKLLNLNENHISSVYEIKGSKKVGHYIPGTRIPIYPEKDLYALNDQNQPILNLAWHIPNEVRENLKKNSYNGKVIDIKKML